MRPQLAPVDSPPEEGPQDAPDQQTEGQGQFDLVDETVDALGQSVRANALRSAGSSEDADAALKFAQAAYAAAQAIKQLLPPPVDPNERAKTEADLTKHGADLAFREQDAAAERDHKLAVAKVQAEAKPAGDANVGAVRSTTQNGGSDG